MGTVPAVEPARTERRPGTGSTMLVAGLGVVLVVGLVSILVTAHRPAEPAPPTRGGAGAPVAAAPAPAPTVVHVVTYQLLGGQTALDITYVANGAGIAQVAESRTLWSVAIERHDPVTSSPYVSVSARNGGPGLLSCRIIVDGRTVAERSVADPHGTVRCSKSLS
jgi:MmpS family membrane protein